MFTGLKNFLLILLFYNFNYKKKLKKLIFKNGLTMLILLRETSNKKNSLALKKDCFFEAAFESYLILFGEQIFLFLCCSTVCDTAAYKWLSILLEIAYPIGMYFHMLVLWCRCNVDTLAINKVILIASCVVQTLWCVRLTCFLWIRMHYVSTQYNCYMRYQHVLPRKYYLAVYLLLQYLTIFVNSLPHLAMFVSASPAPMEQRYTSKELLQVIGVIICTCALAITTTADWQKLQHQLRYPSPNDRSIFLSRNFGVWKCHPHIHYLAEIAFWWGYTLIGVVNVLWSRAYWCLLTLLGAIHITLALLWFANLIDPQVSARKRIGWGLGMHKIAHQEWT
ncbi:hypothetical protein RFI_13052 [Reticulomyxa filosa]|uniref:Steroid 5-alpha reductase C-terminal domain-containing protein n=1 Tax=Reticulomyxa filosa TaxID=46433 RepID=X6NFI8_RETFI|nr:hypothetical protein RFI_13052 [Reticulomyxa filosa]|eukprot:ETO24107.1 hypothetical protein RFI_13052 [Reticulomyxa filosa]